MSEILSGSLDLSKIDKSKIVEGKNGAEYYNIQISINDTPDKYGNIATIIQNQSKEEREAKATKIYIGNLKSVWKSQTKKEEPMQQKSNDNNDFPI